MIPHKLFWERQITLPASTGHTVLRVWRCSSRTPTLRDGMCNATTPVVKERCVTSQWMQVDNYFRHKTPCGIRKLTAAFLSKIGVFSRFSWSLDFGAKMAEFPLPVLHIWRSRKRVAIQIQLMNIHVSECKYYCLHLVPKFGDMCDRQNWRLHPTDITHPTYSIIPNAADQMRLAGILFACEKQPGSIFSNSICVLSAQSLATSISHWPLLLVCLGPPRSLRSKKFSFLWETHDRRIKSPNTHKRCERLWFNSFKVQLFSVYVLSILMCGLVVWKYADNTT